MNLSEEDGHFLNSRSRFVRSWRYVGVALLGLLVSGGVWLYLTRPLIANPLVVADRLREGSIDRATLEFMALMLPVAVLTTFFVCAAFLLLTFAAFNNEAKYREIISRATE